ncbi:MFS transporter [Microbulbifer sp. PSTR4-B]|uniref:MFS transporter n=1 Tax=Microbulbifer sp. PSTR4-B TaxID=3243396 RepID=UPI004039DB54
MAQQNQFTLFTKRRFLPLFLSLISAAFNDNIFKNALLVMLAFRLAESEANALINLATGFYILPYFLFSVTAGQLADKYDKSRIIRILKLAEIFFVLLGAYSLIYNNQILNFIVLFLMATHTAIFSPVQYALLPQHLKRSELMGGNGLAQMASFAGVLVGTIAGTLLAGYTKPGQPGLEELGAIMVVIAVLGYLASRMIPQAPPPTPDLRIDWNPVSQAWRIMRLTVKNPSVFYAILACSWFWLVSSAYLAQVPSLTKNVLGASEPVITIILCCLSIGVAAGSLMCEALSRGRITFGIVPIGALGITLGGLGLGITTAQFDTLSGASISEYLQSDGAYAVLIYTALLGIFGGIFIVPLYTIMQDRTDYAVRAQVLSLNNVLNALFIVLISLLSIFFLDVLKITIPQLFILMALVNCTVMALLFFKQPEFIVHLLVWLSSHLFARTSYGELKHIPATGAALLVCSPAARLAPQLLMDTLLRPIRFILPQGFNQFPLLRFIFNNYSLAPIFYDATRDKEKLSAEIRRAVGNGELICFFTVKDHYDSEYTDIERQLKEVLTHTATPIFPLTLKGLHDEVSGSPNHKKMRFFPKVHISVGQPIAAKDINGSALVE